MEEGHAYLTLALDGSELSFSRPGDFTIGERALGDDWTGGWLDPRECPEAV